MTYNNCRGAVSIPLIEYFFAKDNLYLISEAHDISLVEFLPELIKQNEANEFISTLLIHDMLKIFKNVYGRQHSVMESVSETFDENFVYHQDEFERQSQRNLDQFGHLGEQPVFEPRNFVLMNGRIKYCPNIISRVHNIKEHPPPIQKPTINSFKPDQRPKSKK